jgi:hypothetical protein
MSIMNKTDSLLSYSGAVFYLYILHTNTHFNEKSLHVFERKVGVFYCYTDTEAFVLKNRGGLR